MQLQNFIVGLANLLYDFVLRLKLSDGFCFFLFDQNLCFSDFLLTFSNLLSLEQRFSIHFSVKPVINF